MGGSAGLASPASADGDREEMLPVPLKLRVQAERLAEAVPGMRSEQDVRDAVAELNERIMDWRKLPLGPPIFVPLVDEEAMLGRWRERQPEKSATAPEAQVIVIGGLS